MSVRIMLYQVQPYRARMYYINSKKMSTTSIIPGLDLEENKKFGTRLYRILLIILDNAPFAR